MTLTARATSNVVCWPFWPSATLRHARSSGATHRKHSALDSASAWPHPKNPERIHDPVYLAAEQAVGALLVGDQHVHEAPPQRPPHGIDLGAAARHRDHVAVVAAREGPQPLPLDRQHPVHERAQL